MEPASRWGCLLGGQRRCERGCKGLCLLQATLLMQTALHFAAE